MASEKKKRPPRQVWLVVDERTGVVLFSEAKKTVADSFVQKRLGQIVVGPYCLVERVRNK